MRTVMFSLVLLVSLTAAHADRATAKKLTDKAVKEHYKMGEWQEAIDGYRAALTADPSYATAHYYVASAASILGDFATVRSELTWMKASTDKEASRLLKSALKDPDLDRASVDPGVRALLGLPAIDKLTPEQRLLERRGVWSVPIKTGCGGNFFSFTFKKGGKLAYRQSDDCGGDGQNYFNGNGSWTLSADGTLTVKWNPLTIGLSKNTLVACKGSLPATCFAGKMVYVDSDGKESEETPPRSRHRPSGAGREPLVV